MKCLCSIALGCIVFFAWIDSIEGKKGRARVIVRIPRDLDGVERERERDLPDDDSLVSPQSDAPADSAGSVPTDASGFLILPPDYNKFKIPWRSGMGALPVYISLEAKKVLNFDELEELITLELDLVLSWVDYKILDHRFKLNDTYKPGKDIKDMTKSELLSRLRVINDPQVLRSIWKPNIFFENLISLQQPYVISKPVKLKVLPEAGFIQYLSRVSATVDCDMEFSYYPADTQSCEFVIRPFSYTKNLVKLEYRAFGVNLADTTLQGFDVRADDLHTNEIVDDWDDEEKVFSGLGFTIFVRRQITYHLVQTYLASAFYIVITCLCFLLPHQMIEVKIGISMTTLLTVTAMFGSVRESTPLTSYVKAIDTWMVFCIFFVFLTLAQFTFHTWLRSYTEKIDEAEGQANAEKEEVKNEEESCRNGAEAMEMIDVEIRTPKASAHPRRRTGLYRVPLFQKYVDTVFYIERFSFFIFMSIFAAYAVLYWSWLLTSSDYFEWKVNATMNMER